MRRRPYFHPQDFAAFAVQLATREDAGVIGERKRVVEDRMKPLHRGEAGFSGLGVWLRDRGLDAHWSPGHLTNVYWPYPIANSGWVDYLRMGYGKPEHLVKEFARLSGAYQTLTSQGSYDAMAFHHVTQVQIGLSEDSWWIDWYQDRHAWLEQNNWLTKIKNSKSQRQQLMDLLDALCEEGYCLSVYPRKEVAMYKDYDEPEDFVDAVTQYRQDGLDISISVGLRFDLDDPHNNAETLPEFVRQEFERLLPLYRFTSWHPKTNDQLFHGHT